LVFKGMVGDEIPHARCDPNGLTENETPKNIEEKQCFLNSGVSSKVDEAALWLVANYDEVQGNPLLALMAHFSISVLDAVAASKRAHALRYGGVRG